jgi:hypothetical protein
MKKNKILVGLFKDGIDNQAILNYAIRLAETNNFELDIIYVEPLHFITQTPSKLNAQDDHPMELIKEKVMHQKINEVKNELNNYTSTQLEDYSITISPYSFSDHINKTYSKGEVEMCLIQKVNKNNYFNALFGTRETNISKAIDYPVLNIPKTNKGYPFQNMLFIVNEFSNCQFDAFNSLLAKFNFDYTFLINNDGEHIEIKEFFNSTNLSWKNFKGSLRFTNKDFSIDQLKNIVKKDSFDCIAINNFDKTFFERPFELNTNELILELEVPILVI